MKILSHKPGPRITWIAALALLAGALLIVADLGATALVYGPAYVRRIVLWREPTPHDDQRFPTRPIAASAKPTTFAVDPTGTSAVDAAFRRIAPAAAKPGETLAQFLARTKTTSFLVLHDDRLLYERYFNGHTRETVQGSFSIAKSVTSMLIGAAIADGKLPPIGTQAATLLPDARHLRGSGVTLRNLLDMTSGFHMDNARPFGPFSAPWTDYKLMYFSPELRRVAEAARPQFRPGTHFLYDDRNAMLLGIVLERAVGEHVATYLQQRFWQPMGAAFPASWSLDRAGGFEKMESGINARPIDFLQLGQLVVNDGVADNGKRLLPASWIDAMTTPTPHVAGWPYGTDRFYGLMWWGFYRQDAPPDVFADGIFGQVLYVSRARGTVILRTGDGEGGVDWPALLRDFVNALPAGSTR